MEIYLATDHAGFYLKEDVKKFLLSSEFDVHDCGAHVLNLEDGYPYYVHLAAQAVSEDPKNRKMLIFGGSGQGESIVANRHDHVRVAVFYGLVIPVAAADISGRTSDDPYEIVKLSRTHNDANGLSIAARFVTTEQAIKAVGIWLEEPFSGEKRHLERINAIDEITKGLRNH